MAAEGMNKQISREKNCDGDQILSSKHRSTKKISNHSTIPWWVVNVIQKTYGSEQKKLIHTSWLFSHCLFWSSYVKKKELNFKPKWFSNLQNLSKKDASLWILEESFTPYLNTATGENLSFFFRQILDCQKIDVCVHDDDQISMTWKASKKCKDMGSISNIWCACLTTNPSFL